MPKIFNLGNHNQRSSGDCRRISPVQSDLLKKVEKSCGVQSQAICEDKGRWKSKGDAPMCDPMQTGSILNDMLAEPKRKVINRYANAIGGCNEAIQKLFQNIVVEDPDGKAHPVPLIPGPQEKAIAWLMAEHARKDNTLVVDRPLLPLMAIHHSDTSYDANRYIYHKAAIRFNNPSGKPGMLMSEDRENDTVFRMAAGIPINIGYTLYAWTEFLVDMNQILEQVLLKFSPVAYIDVKGVPWETLVKLDSIGNNVETEPGDQAIRVVKYQFSLTVETYIPQPIFRDKTVLEIKTDFVNSVNEEEITEVYNRQEIKVEENGN